MATNKSKPKTATKKLKPSKKKSISKWIIVVGVVAVAAIGVVVVRFSSASRWYSVYYSRNVRDLSSTNRVYSTPDKVLKKGNTYRFCVRGGRIYAGNTTLTLQFTVWNSAHTYGRDRAVSEKGYNTLSSSGELHCSKEFRATQDYLVQGSAILTKGQAVDMMAVSIDQLR